MKISKLLDTILLLGVIFCTSYAIAFKGTFQSLGWVIAFMYVVIDFSRRGIDG
jgi:hypothetical protein